MEKGVSNRRWIGSWVEKREKSEREKGREKRERNRERNESGGGLSPLKTTEKKTSPPRRRAIGGFPREKSPCSSFLVRSPNGAAARRVDRVFRVDRVESAADRGLGAEPPFNRTEAVALALRKQLLKV